MARDTLLLTFCNQQASLFHSLCVLDLADGRVGWIDLESAPGEFRDDFGGVCGACAVGERVVICTQSNEKPMLAMIDPRTGSIGSTLPLPGCRDPHSVAFQDGHVYVTSTGTNEIYRVAVQGEHFGEQELFWRYPGVRYDRDEVHLNGITVADGRFITSCFGSRKPDGSWDTAGSVFYLDSGLPIRGGLNQPHTPLVIADRLVFAESAANKVFMYAKTAAAAWTLDAEFEMPGYTRGLALEDGRLFVGISSSRTVSRSRKTAVSAPQQSSNAAIISVHLETQEQEIAWDLSAYAREVYDMISVPRATWLTVPSDALSRRVNGMEAMIERYIVHAQALQSQTEALQSHTEALQSQLNEARDVICRLLTELEMTHKTVSWRLTAPLRAGRRALGPLLARFRRSS